MCSSAATIPTNCKAGGRRDVWAKFPGYPALITSEYAIKIYGQGHVVAYNYVANWHDGIDIATYGDPDGTPDELRDRVPVSIDFYNNDIYNMADNCIEADGGAHNIRVFRNRCFNSAGGAFSAQPIFGGPLYFYQNLAYDNTTGGPLKLIDTPAGVLIYQNTFVGQGRLMGPASNVHFLNNLILGDGWADPVFNLRTYTNYSTSDYNGFRPNPGVDNAFEWTSPAFRSRGRLSGQARHAHFQVAQGVQPGDGAGPAQHSARLRYFREREDAGQIRPAASLQSRGFRFPSASRAQPPWMPASRSPPSTTISPAAHRTSEPTNSAARSHTTARDLSR